MSPIQQMLLGAGAVATKTYMDDVFSTYLWKGNDTARSINNGINLSQDGGLTWIKSRSNTEDNWLFDTVNGADWALRSNLDNARYNTGSPYMSAFNSNGFSIGTHDGVNDASQTYSSWSFRKAPGFFDVVTYTGNGTAGRTVSHSLGCEPGMIIIKNLDSNEDWRVYHRSLGGTHNLVLNSNVASAASSSVFNQTNPTASVFTVGTSDATNQNGDDFVAYVFAGGESNASEARSVDFDGSGDYLVTNNSSDYDLGTGDFTCELWFYHSDDSNDDIVDRRTANASVEWDLNVDNNQIKFIQGSTTKITSRTMPKDTWYHIAMVRHSGTTTMYIDGTSQGSFSDTNDYDNTEMLIGTYMNPPSYELNGGMSNLRLVKGTAVYTSAFRVPTEPLTNISGTVLLCCNNSSVTGTTVGTVTSGGNPTASTDSPFDDPAAFTFGDAGDQNVIKCGSYVGNGSATGPEINLGWEPQWILIKSASSGNWCINDMMRGFFNNGTSDDKTLFPSLNNAELGFGVGEFTSTGFILRTSDNNWNSNGDKYVYMCLRRPDGYVGKPPELGTDVFSLATGTNNTNPGFVSGFPVDLSLRKIYASSGDWFAASRLTGTNYFITNSSAAENSNSNQTFDFQNGVGKWGGNLTTYMSWQWKRHAGFDVVTYDGNGVAGRQIPHSLSKIPEMLFIKCRDDSQNWIVGHKGLNGGTNPEHYNLVLNSTAAEVDDFRAPFNDTPHTSTYFNVKSDALVNGVNKEYIAMLFASVDGISKVGSYSGTDGSNITITTGFQPRFIMVKKVDGAGAWIVFDTTRGMGSGNDKLLKLNSSNSQVEVDYVTPSSTGWQTVGGNLAQGDFIYYAHA